MPVVANELNERLPNLPAPLLAACDHAANIFAISGRKGIVPPAIQVVAPVHNFGREDVAFISWAAALGYREGRETRS